ncbi:MAG TPA: hypothetical protein VGI19_12705 [Candidatus Cybelea sp.]
MLHFTASFARRAAAISVLGGLIAGCSSAGVPTANPASDSSSLANGHGVRTSAPQVITHGWMSPDAKKKKSLIYWGDYNNSTITIYSAKGTNGKELGQITTGLSNPERLFVDKQGSVYATNIGTGTITAYKRGKTSPFLTISNGVNRPTGLTVDGAGNVYCANVGNNTITVYPKGSTSPSETLSASTPEYLATDAKDNLYASVANGIEEWGPGSSNGTMLGLPAGANGIEVDKSGNFIGIYGAQIEYFPAGSNQPSMEIPVNGSPYALSLSGNEKQLYVSVESGSPFIIQNVAYPKGTTLSTKLSNNGGQWPFAVSPDSALGT